MNDRPWFKHYGSEMPRTLHPYPACTMLDVVDEVVRERPQHTAWTFKGRRATYADFEQWSDALGAALTALGVAKGDRVAVLLPNSPQAILSQFGAWKAGAIFCPINPLYTEREIEHSLNEVGAETVIVLTTFYQKLKAVQPRTKVRRVIATNIKEYLPPVLRLAFTLLKEKKEGHRVSLQPGDLWLADLMRQYRGRQPDVQVTPQDRAILLFSGGTTGAPKAALGTHQAMIQTTMQLRAYARTVMNDWDDGLTWAMPLFHVYGNLAMLTSVMARWPISIVVSPRDLDDLIATVEKEKPAILHGVPTLFIALLAHPKIQSGQADLTSLKMCYSAAAPLMSETRQRFEAVTGGRLLEAYAMTETMLAAVCCPVHGEYKEGSTGIPVPDVDVRVVDADLGEQILPAGQVGEIIVQAPQLMVGYWESPTETANMIRENPAPGLEGRWAYTGDLGYLDKDGYVFIVDRKKDVIKPGGMQVWPREVEEVIAMHPAVAEVSVAGVPDAYQGEACKAWVILREGQAATADEIRAHCREHLVAYKIPKYVEFRAQLPKTMVGKVLRRELVAQELADKD